jgi:beta-N-acetylhexosaminidase
MSTAVGPIVFDLIGTELSSEEHELLQHPLIGGLIFFTRNYESPEQITQLCQTIRSARKLPILLAVDQEGGRVQRFRQEFTRLPDMGKIGKVYDASSEQGLRLATTCGWLMAAEVLAVGVDLSFAPMLDIDKKNNPVIGDRAFHRETDVVVKLATAFTQGMREAGMAAVGKHFPGHGSVTVDSHLDLPQDDRTLEQIAAEDMKSFAKMIAAGIEGIMAAHILFSSVDKTAVGFSRFWLQEVLRKQLDFKGMIFTDCLTMEGAKIAGGFPDRVEAALEAGCDMALICNNRASVIKTVDGLPADKYFVDPQRFARVQGNFSSIQKTVKQTNIWRENLNFMTETLGMDDVKLNE